MREKPELLIHFVVTLCKLCTPGGAKAIIAENCVIKQQLVAMNRGNKRSPKLTPSDRILFDFWCFSLTNTASKELLSSLNRPRRC
jgi:hypothetical protein